MGAFQWRDRGLDATEGRAVSEAASIAGYLDAAARERAAASPDDVIAVRIIGAGRGASVAGLAMADLASATTPAPLRLGWHSLTLIDPTPATPGAAFAGPGPLGRLSRLAASWFAARASDPSLVIPADVQQADVYFERSGRSTSLADRLAGTPTSFRVPSMGSTQPTYHDVSARARGLSGLEAAYLKRVAPSLARQTAASLGRVVTAAAAARRPRARASAASLDRRALESAIPSRHLADRVFHLVRRAARLIARARPAAAAAIEQAFQDVAANAPATTTTTATEPTTALLTTFSCDVAALTGQTPAPVPGVQQTHPTGALPEVPTAATTVPHATSADPTADAVVDLRSAFLDDPNFATPFDQQYEDCSANSLAGAIDYLIATDPSLGALNTQGFEPSRLFLFYNTRFIEGDPFSDAGTYQSDAVRVAEAQGLTSEGSPTSDSTGATWPYPGPDSPDVKKQYEVNPGADNAVTGPLYTVTSASAFPTDSTLDDMKAVLNNHQVFTFWTNCDFFPQDNQHWPGFQPGQTPTLPAPPDQTPSPDDGHFMLCVGYD
ncbi:MAG TPA: hypothetical protein VKW77_00670, partial [Acidimicrobiales bacterium]|nr:hypothetical protein [Acidimicrobiales bacterium]